MINLQQTLAISQDLNCLVPQQWYKYNYQRFTKYIDLNKYSEALQFPQIDYKNFMYLFNNDRDNFLLEYKDLILNQIQQQCNLDNFNKLTIMPEPLHIEWRIIPLKLWKMFCGEQTPLFTINSKEIFPIKQIRIVFFSNFQKHLFIGHFNQQLPIITIVKQIGKYLGFQHGINSLISFPELNNKKYYYDQVEMLLKQINSIVIAENLSKDYAGFQIQKVDDQNSSNEAVAGDLLDKMQQAVQNDQDLMDFQGQIGNKFTYQKLQDNDAKQQQFSFFETDSYNIGNNEYKNQRLKSTIFKNKSDKQILIMKQYAQEAVKANNLIEIPLKQQLQMEYELNQMANSLIQYLKKSNH